MYILALFSVSVRRSVIVYRKGTVSRTQSGLSEVRSGFMFVSFRRFTVLPVKTSIKKLPQILLPLRQRTSYSGKYHSAFSTITLEMSMSVRNRMITSSVSSLTGSESPFSALSAANSVII